MRFFLDTANLDELKTGASWGILDGVTTNPTLIAKEGVAIEDQIHKICEIVDGDVSAEVVATTTDGMLAEGRRLARIHKNVVVKVPLTREGIRACSFLSREGIRVNVTLCFSAAQALLAAKAVSQFVVVTAWDPATFAIVGAVLALAALGSCYAPAHSAMTVEPMVALREE